MVDTRIQKFARILVDYSTRVKPGDTVAIYTGTAAEEMARELYAQVLDRGGHPEVLMDFRDQDEIMFAHANEDQLERIPLLRKAAFEDFDVLIKVKAEDNTRALTNVDPGRHTRWFQKAFSPLLRVQTTRGAHGTLRWMSTRFPTYAYAMEADMGLQEYEDFFFRACHADEGTADPIAYWEGVRLAQERIVERLNGRDRIEIYSPNAELSLSAKGRTFLNASGQTNMPDGEVFTGPVENSANGWVRYTYPAVYEGRVVEGIELTFEEGRVVKATARKNESFLLEMLNTDPGARYLGEFAIGNNYEIDRFTRSILLDEKIGGSFHTALGAGYLETGSQNKSAIHWDMICDIRQDSEVRVDGEVIYRDGKFVF